MMAALLVLLACDSLLFVMTANRRLAGLDRTSVARVIARCSFVSRSNINQSAAALVEIAT